MTQEEAMKRWCPFASSRVLRTFPDQAVTYAVDEVATVTCIASDCMAWRWSSDFNRLMERYKDRRDIDVREIAEGHCGLAGKP